MTSLIRNLSEFNPVPFSRTHPAPRLGERLDFVSRLAHRHAAAPAWSSRVQTKDLSFFYDLNQANFPRLFTGTGEASQTSASDKQQCSDWDASPLRRIGIHSSPDKLIGCVFYKLPPVSKPLVCGK